MKLKELQSLMQDIAVFDNPKLDLEQYPTGPHLASRLLFTVDNAYNEFEGKVVADLGCGTGMLSIGAAMLGSPHVIGIDIDDDALCTAQENCEQFEGLQIDFVQCNISQLQSQSIQLWADVVIMNPPFGTRRKGADLEFLQAAFQISKGSIYSLHKSSTRQHIQKTAMQRLKAKSAEVLAQLRYDLPPTFVFHKQKSKDIEVDLWRFEVSR